MMRTLRLAAVTAAALMAGTIVASAHGYAHYGHGYERVAPRGGYEFRSGWFHERMANPGESYIGIQDRGNAESMGCPC